MKKKRIIIISIVIVLVAAGFFIYQQKKKGEAKTEWLTEKAASRDIRIAVTATGTLNPVQSIQVGTQVSGVISKIWVDYNDVVKKNQPIAELDKSNLRAAYDASVANLQKARAQYIQTQAEYERNKFLLEKKVIPKADYDLAMSNFKTSGSAVSIARTDVERARTNLQYATITAPINGVIVSRDVEVGQTVAASFSTPKLFVIANNLKDMQLEAKVDEADIGEVKIGQEATFTVDAYPGEEFKGIVKQIRLQPNITQNVVNYSVIITAPNPDLKLLPGMNADLSIIVKQKQKTMAIPITAIKFTPPIANEKDSSKVAKKPLLNKDQQQVYVLQNNELKPIVVSTGLSDGVYIEVTSANINPSTQLVVGTKGKEEDKQTKSIFQGPRPQQRSGMRSFH